MSSFAVVLIGLIPTLLGGPIFALGVTILGIAGFREYLALANRLSLVDLGSFMSVGTLAIIGFALAATLDPSAVLLLTLAFVAVAAPLLRAFTYSSRPGAFVAWTITSIGCLYLGLAVFSAIAMRSSAGTVAPAWLNRVTERLSVQWEAAPRGLAWTLTVIVAIWVGDSVAYLVGRAFGKRKLAPRISPSKTVVGALGGLVASSIVSASAFALFEIGPPALGLGVGCVLGLSGQLGDLGESFLKRQAGVKDSGATIPGHGGILDRIDALLFAFPAGMVVAAAVDWMQL